MSIDKLRAFGAIAGKIAECALGMAAAHDRGDDDEMKRLSGDLIRLSVATTQLSGFFMGAPSLPLMEAWRAMGRSEGWEMESPPPTESAGESRWPAVLDDLKTLTDLTELPGFILITNPEPKRYHILVSGMDAATVSAAAAALAKGRHANAEDDGAERVDADAGDAVPDDACRLTMDEFLRLANDDVAG
jgi:hypothetical protein